MNYIGYVHGYVYPTLELFVVPPIYTPRTIGNQFLTVVQSITSMDKGPIQQQVNTPLPTTKHVNINLQTYLPVGFNHQPPDGL
jgi:hypothetical protein